MMEIELNVFNLSHLAAMILGLASGLVLFYFSLKHNPSLFPLSLGQLSLFGALIINFLIINHLLYHFPSLYRLGNFFAWIYVPLPYLYLRLHLSNRRLQWVDLIHFIPWLIYVIDLWPSFMLPNEEKIRMILQEDPVAMNNFNQSRFFSPGFYPIVRALFVNAYWIAQVVIIRKWIQSKSRFKHPEKIWLRWMVTIIGLQFFLFFPFYVSIIWGIPWVSYHMVNSMGALMLLATSMMIFFYPSILNNRIQKIKREVKIGNGKEAVLDPNTMQDSLTDPMLEKTMEEKLNENNRFLNIRYSIHNFSEDIGLPVYLISQYLNQHLQMSFNDFVNKRRIQYCAAQFENGRFLPFSMDAVARECGFNNRNSFTKAFQKFQGTSPSAFRKMQIARKETIPGSTQG